MNESPISFSFGRNWQFFNRQLTEEAVHLAIRDTEEWLSDERVKDRDILDIGCGSGLHSLAFFKRGAANVVSFDADQGSVDATRSLWEREQSPPNWRISAGSILDPACVQSFQKKFDVVYSWGVLHHTGNQWQALENAISLVKPGGLIWISLYAKGQRYQRDLALKKRYNAASRFGKWWLERQYILSLMKENLRQGQNPFAWNKRKERGMDTWHDIVDWLGGLPYEVASVDEVLDFARRKDFTLEKVKTALEGDCQIYLLAAPNV